LGDQLHALTAVLPGKWAKSHSNSHRPERLEKEKTSCPHLDSNPTIQPVGSHYNIYAIPPLSHTEGDGINVAHRRGKYHENYTS